MYVKISYDLTLTSISLWLKLQNQKYYQQLICEWLFIALQWIDFVNALKNYRTWCSGNIYTSNFIFWGAGGVGGVGMVEGILWLFSSAFIPNLWENVLKSFEDHEKSSTSMKLS